jgi:hypothetical protein
MAPVVSFTRLNSESICNSVYAAGLISSLCLCREMDEDLDLDVHEPAHSSAAGVAGCSSPGSHTISSKPLIVVDGPNVYMHAHSTAISSVSASYSTAQRKGSMQRVLAVLEYWRSRGHPVLTFFPEYFLKKQTPAVLSEAAVTSAASGRAPTDADVVSYLSTLGVAVITPPRDVDDLYALEYARAAGAFVVSNDLFRDHVAASHVYSDAVVSEMQRWVDNFVIGYAFRGDVYLPNPAKARVAMVANVVHAEISPPPLVSSTYTRYQYLCAFVVAFRENYGDVFLFAVVLIRLLSDKLRKWLDLTGSVPRVQILCIHTTS